jgi:hypothetical protein
MRNQDGRAKTDLLADVFNLFNQQRTLSYNT